MGVNEFYDYLPKHFWNKLDGCYELENIRERGRWERTRWQTTLLLNIQIAKGKKIKVNFCILFSGIFLLIRFINFLSLRSCNCILIN